MFQTLFFDNPCKLLNVLDNLLTPMYLLKNRTGDLIAKAFNVLNHYTLENETLASFQIP